MNNNHNQTDTYRYDLRAKKQKLERTKKIEAQTLDKKGKLEFNVCSPTKKQEKENRVKKSILKS